MQRIGLYPGSFDPMTHGHLDVLRQAFTVFDRVVCAIGIHHGKTPLFSFEERARMMREAAAEEVADVDDRLQVIAFEGLAVDAARQVGAVALVRGLRDGTDLDYEMQMAGMNSVMAPDLTTIMFPASPARRPITGSLVRQVASMGGDISSFVPAVVASALKARYAGRNG
ncbi:pantetheine-phosphate adenylyltransferase [Consotaella aegiceratis]|uniref:pantetheine-phosphate adenylyltransferase n=1 Tax=Consotaella aegiceratis TaxID=3097961 RepID=UPI002F3EA56D